MEEVLSHELLLLVEGVEYAGILVVLLLVVSQVEELLVDGVE